MKPSKDYSSYVKMVSYKKGGTVKKTGPALLHKGEYVVPKAKLGSGKRFAKLKSTLAAKGARNPGALAAYIGRKKFGKARFQKLAAKGKKGY